VRRIVGSRITVHPIRMLAVSAFIFWIVGGRFDWAGAQTTTDKLVGVVAVFSALVFEILFYLDRLHDRLAAVEWRAPTANGE
jgi:hypothetical protein